MSALVLVLDNKLVVSDLARQVLSPLGHTVSPVIDMSLGIFLARKSLPDLIVCNNGIEAEDLSAFLSELRTDADLSQIPVVMISYPLSAAEFLDQVKGYLFHRDAYREPETSE